MNLFENLKQLKRIKPDAEFAAFSRGKILKQNTLAWILRENSPMAFASVALVLLFVFAGTRFFTGSKIAALDPGGLKAEAQAIDIQIQLTNLDYSSAGAMESTPAAVLGSSQTSTQSSAGDSIDDALKALSR